jgi:hypothetical protein
MNTEELVELTSWISEQVVDRELPRLYAEIASALRNTANGSPQPFETQKDELTMELQKVDLPALSNDQRSFLKRLNLLEHMGQSGVSELQDILYRNSLDVSTAAKKIEDISTHIQSAVDRSKLIRASLSGLVDVQEGFSDEITIRVAFDGGASVEDIVDFKKWAATWFDIGRGVAMAVGEAPEDIRVLGAQKGSIIVILATTCGIAGVISKILLKSLEVAEKVLGLKKQLLEIEALHLSNDALATQIKKAADEEKKVGLEKVSREVVASIQLQNGEKISALDKSISKLLDFIEKGGQVDVVLPVGSEGGEGDDDAHMVDREQVNGLREDVRRIREMEEQIRRLPRA